MIRALEDDFKHVVGIRQVISGTGSALLHFAAWFLNFVVVPIMIHFLLSFFFSSVFSFFFTFFVAVGIFGSSWLSSCSLMLMVLALL